MREQRMQGGNIMTKINGDFSYIIYLLRPVGIDGGLLLVSLRLLVVFSDAFNFSHFLL